MDRDDNMPLVRVTRRFRCPICGRPEWCSYNAETGIVVCMREFAGSYKSSRNGGWVHKYDFVNGPQRPPAPDPVQSSLIVRDDLLALVTKWSANLESERLHEFATSLGLSPASLSALDIGWTGKEWSFPMRAPSLDVVGIRLRGTDGKKFAVKGSKDGLFIPTFRHECDRLYIAEGPTDTAAMWGLGLDAVGRPSCAGAVDFARAVAVDRDVVIVADGDEAGQRGAAALAEKLVKVTKSVRIIEPPFHKDAREWITKGGASRRVIEGIVRSRRPLTG